VSARIAQFSALVTQQPDNALFRFSLAQALEAAGTERHAEAIEQYRRCVAARADWMMPRILLGKLLLRTRDISAARPLLEDALKLALEQDHQDPAAELQALIASL